MVKRGDNAYWKIVAKHKPVCRDCISDMLGTGEIPAAVGEELPSDESIRCSRCGKMIKDKIYHV